MTGGLLQLVAYGNQDALLTINPEFTFFKSLYHRYTNFSKVTNKIDVSKKLLFGTINNVNIPKNADLLDNIYIHLELPTLSVEYERELYEELSYQINNSSLDVPIKFITKTEYNNLYENVGNINNFIDNKQYYNCITHFTDSTNTANNMYAGLINVNNLIDSNLSLTSNVDVYYLINKELIISNELDSTLFKDFDNAIELTREESILKTNFDNVSNNNYFQKLLLNLFYNNNVCALINYLKFKSDNYDINTANEYLESLNDKILYYYTNNNYNLLAYNLISFNSLLEYGKTLDFNTSIYGTNKIEINFDSEYIYETTTASDYNILFLIDSNTFSLKNIKSVLLKDSSTSTTTESYLYNLFTSTFSVSNNFCLSNYLNVTGWSNSNTIYTVSSKNLKANSDEVYQITISSVSNLEINQIIFGFNNSTNTINTTPDFVFFITKINESTNSIEGKIFDNKMYANNITFKNLNTNDYNNYEISYVSNGLITIYPISSEIYHSDIWINYKFINSSTNSSIIGLSQTDYYTQLIKYSKTVISLQKQILQNYLDALFINNYYISITYTVNQSTSEVNDYYETSLWDSSFTKFINTFLYTDNSKNNTFTLDSNTTPEFIYNKFINKVTNYLNSSNLPSYFTPKIKNNFGLLISKSYETDTNILTLINQIQYLTTTNPFITILLEYSDSTPRTAYGSEYYNTTTIGASGSSVTVGDILHLYNSGDESSPNNLIGIFKVISVDTNNLYKINLSYESYNSKYTGYSMTTSKIDTLNDGAYLFKTNDTNTIDVTKRLTISGNILDESKYVFTINQLYNYYLDYSSNTSGTSTTNTIAIGKYIYIYESVTSTYNSSSADFKVKLLLSKISPINNDENSERQYIFYLDNTEDTDFVFDTTNKTYFGFCQNDANDGIDVTKGFVINTVTINSRFFTMNALNNVSEDSTKKGYKYTNILYNVYCMYLYNELKSSTNTAFNKILLGRLFLISNKIYQMISLNTSYSSSLESLTTTIKLTYFSDFTKIFNSSTIVNELFADFSSTSSILEALKIYLNGKYVDEISNNIATRTTYTYSSSIFSKVVGTYGSTTATSTTISDANVTTEIIFYFKLILDQLTNSYYSTITDIENFNNIPSKKLYYIAANDFICEEYIDIIDNIYYDDLVDKKSKEIGILFNEYISDSNSITSTIVRDIIQNEVLIYNTVHSLPTYNTYITNLNSRYDDSTVSTSFSQLLINYLNNEDLVNKITNIDLIEDLTISDTTIKNNIYSKLGLSVEDNTNFDTKINEVFVTDETNKSIYSIFNQSAILSNEVYDFLNKFIFMISMNQIFNIIPSYFRSVQINNIINTNDITLDIINTYLVSLSKDAYVNLTYTSDSTNIYIPSEYTTNFKKKLAYINALSTAQKTTESAIWTHEISGIMREIKIYYFTSGSSYKSIKTLEDTINGSSGYFSSTTTPYYKLIRGCIVSDTEYTSLNYNSVEGIIYEIDSYGGIEKIFLPFDITSIFCSSTDSTSQITLSLDNSIVNIQSNNNPSPGDNSLTITDISYNYNINCRFGLNIKQLNIMEKGDIGISINGVILRNSYALTIPNSSLSAPDSFYEGTLDSIYYNNYNINAISSTLIQVNDVIRLYSTSLISDTLKIVDVTITSVSDNTVKFRSAYDIKIIENIYGYKVVSNSTSYNLGFKINSITVESFRLNIIPYFSQFTIKEDNYHGAIDSNNSFNYYSGKFMNALSSITNTYLDTSNYSSDSGDDKLRHTDGHSKILGISYDGYPIYGPYGYKDVSLGGDVELMKSSYRLKSEFTDNRNSIIVVSDTGTITYDAGTIIEDYEYESGYGHLDESNGRYCITPEFPNGTYAYFLTFDSSMNPEYPYIIGNKFYNEPNIGVSESFVNNNIRSSSNISSYSDNDVVNLVGGNGKYGKGTINSTTNNIKYIEISAKGLNYKKNDSFYAFKEIPDTLEYVDEYKLYLRRKSRFYDGYYYDYTNNKLNLLSPVDTTSQTTVTNSLNKVNEIKIDLLGLISSNNEPDLSILDVYDSKYETILNILNIDDLIIILSSLSPEFFDSEKLISLLNESITTKSINFSDIIDNSINYLFKKFKTSYKLFYTSDISIEKDYNLSDLKLDEYYNYDTNDTFKSKIKDMISLYQKNMVSNKSEYDSYKTNESTYLNRATVPSFSWIGNVGNFIFDEIELYFNDLLIDKQYSDWINIWHELNNTYNKKELLERMIGNIKELTELSTTSKESKTLMLPLRFWFCRNSGFNIPLIAMPYVNINLKFKISDVNNLVRKDIGTKIVLGSELNMKLLVNYIYLDDSERKLFAEARHEYLIEQSQFNGISNIASSVSLVNVYFRNNIKDIYWLVDSDKNLYEKDRNNYSLTNINNSGNPITNTKILFNGKKYVNHDGTYTNYLVPLEKYKSTPCDGINVYKFGLEDDSQPKGSLNFSMLDKVQMEISIDSSYLLNSNKKILVFGNSYNILRIMSGLAGLAFIE